MSGGALLAWKRGTWVGRPSFFCLGGDFCCKSKTPTLAKGRLGWATRGYRCGLRLIFTKVNWIFLLGYGHLGHVCLRKNVITVDSGANMHRNTD